MTTEKKAAGPRGFAALDKATVKKHATAGGIAGHKAKTAHEWDSNSARVAGAKGGKTTHDRRRAKKAAADSTKTGGKIPDPKRQVEVVCSSSSGCAGTQEADKAGDDMVGEMSPSPSQDADGGSEASEGGAHGSCGSK